MNFLVFLGFVTIFLSCDVPDSHRDDSSLMIRLCITPSVGSQPDMRLKHFALA